MNKYRKNGVPPKKVSAYPLFQNYEDDSYMDLNNRKRLEDELSYIYQSGGNLGYSGNSGFSHYLDDHHYAYDDSNISDYDEFYYQTPYQYGYDTPHQYGGSYYANQNSRDEKASGSRKYLIETSRDEKVTGSRKYSLETSSSIYETQETEQHLMIPDYRGLPQPCTSVTSATSANEIPKSTHSHYQDGKIEMTGIHGSPQIKMDSNRVKVDFSESKVGKIDSVTVKKGGVLHCKF